MFINGDVGLKMCLFSRPANLYQKASSYRSSPLFFAMILIVNTTTGESSSVCFNSYSLAFEVCTINVCTSVDKNHKNAFSQNMYSDVLSLFLFGRCRVFVHLHLKLLKNKRLVTLVWLYSRQFFYISYSVIPSNLLTHNISWLHHTRQFVRWIDMTGLWKMLD